MTTRPLHTHAPTPPGVDAVKSHPEYYTDAARLERRKAERRNLHKAWDKIRSAK
jgi:hypothetical protein